MKKLFVLLPLLLCCPLLADPAANVKGIETAMKKLKFDLKTPSVDLPMSVTQTCHVFLDFVVVEVSSGQKGSDSISVRPRPKKADVEKLCAPLTLPGELQLAKHKSIFLGTKGKLLLTVSPDTFGNLGTLWAFDVKTGKQIFEDNFSAGQLFIVGQRQQAVSFEYHKQLKLSCDLKGEDKDCWANTLKEHKVPPRVRLKRPECASALPGAAVQVFTPVRIEHVGRSPTVFLGGEPVCVPTP